MPIAYAVLLAWAFFYLIHTIERAGRSPRERREEAEIAAWTARTHAEAVRVRDAARLARQAQWRWLTSDGPGDTCWRACDYWFIGIASAVTLLLAALFAR